MPKRHGRSNYEIMSRASQSAPPLRASRGGRSPITGLWSAGVERAQSLWDGAKDRLGELAGSWSGGVAEPVTLRVSPKWLFLGAAVVVLGTVAMLAVTWQMGQRTLLASLDAEQRSAIELAQRVGTEIPGGGDRTSPPTVHRLDPTPLPAPAHRADPRQPGLNYLVYAFTIPTEADRLAGFLRERGVDVFLVPVQNGRFVMVIDVTRGFTADELRGESYRAFENTRRQLGKDWQRHNNGRGDDLATMMPYKYVGDAPQTP